MGLSRFGAALDEGLHRRLVAALAPRGWRPRVIGLTGYGSERSLHVLGRVLLTRPPDDGAPGPAASGPAPGIPAGVPDDPLALDELLAPDLPGSGPAPTDGPAGRATSASVGDTGMPPTAPGPRGWRSFFTARVGNLPVRVRAGTRVVTTTSDKGGYIDVLVTDHGLAPGWNDVVIEARGARPTTAKVLVVPDSARLGVVSDIDDTIVVTMLPRPLLAAWNTFVRHATARRAVPGMARLLRALRDQHPDAPVFYLSTGAWDVVPTLRWFMRRHGFPEGPMLMTDWAPTNTGWFRSGIEHKRTRLRDLMITFPQIRWVLVGDDGQHDPLVYDDVAREHPGKVAAIAIRELTPAEQVLSHGTPERLGAPTAMRNATAEHGVPTVTGKDGYTLLRRLPRLLSSPTTPPNASLLG